MSSDELFTRIIYFAMAHLHMTLDEVLVTPFGFLNDMHECFLQERGLAVPHIETTIDDIFPIGMV